jgi:hypothetical protein
VRDSGHLLSLLDIHLANALDLVEDSRPGSASLRGVPVVGQCKRRGVSPQRCVLVGDQFAPYKRFFVCECVTRC